MLPSVRLYIQPLACNLVGHIKENVQRKHLSHHCSAILLRLIRLDRPTIHALFEKINETHNN